MKSWFKSIFFTLFTHEKKPQIKFSPSKNLTVENIYLYFYEFTRCKGHFASIGFNWREARSGPTPSLAASLTIWGRGHFTHYLITFSLKNFSSLILFDFQKYIERFVPLEKNQQFQVICIFSLCQKVFGRDVCSLELTGSIFVSSYLQFKTNNQINVQ